MKFEYLLFNLICFLLPFSAYLIFSNRIKVQKKSFFYALVIPAIIFIIIDIFSTDLFWSFNPAYVLGIHLLNLPLEEVLFFLTVPFGCLFLFIALKSISTKTATPFNFPYLPSIFLLIPLILLSLTKGHYYTVVVLMLTILVLGLDCFLGIKLMRYRYWLYYLVLIAVLTTIFNGYLTARPVVTYNSQFKSNLMIFTIPLEDYLFGISLVSLNCLIYEKLNSLRKST